MGNFVWALPVLAVLALALLAWRQRARVARLVCVALPPYDIPELIRVGGLVVENRGAGPAPNVKVEISYDRSDSAKIQHMHISSEEPYILRGGGEEHNFATIRLRQLRPGKRLVVYWAAHEEFQPRISVTSYRPAFSLMPSSMRPAPVTLLRGLRRRLVLR